MGLLRAWARAVRRREPCPQRDPVVKRVTRQRPVSLGETGLDPCAVAASWSKLTLNPAVPRIV